MTDHDSRFTHPVCDDCWARIEMESLGVVREPHRIVEEYREEEYCCWCAMLTRSGIYRRETPELVPECPRSRA